jgi:putative spermidine/putrescine transport system permease protein
MRERGAFRRHRLVIPTLLVAPTLIILFGFFVIPLATLFTFSFYKALPGGLMAPAFTLENYRRFLTDAFHLRVLWNTIKLGLTVTAWCLLLGFPLAYRLARLRQGRVRGLLLTLLLFPLLTSTVVRSYGWMILLAGNGLVNTVLLGLGVAREPLQFMYTPGGTAVALVEVLLPFMVLSLLPVIQNIDRTLELAARSLGATGWRSFLDVVLPLSLPGIAGGSILIFTLAIASFATPALIGGAKFLVMSLFVYQQVLSLFNWPFGAAVSFILLVLVLVLIAAQTRLLERKSPWKSIK